MRSFAFFLIDLIICMSVFTSSAQKSINESGTVLKIHYLGHSSFVLQFDNDITVVCDYGHYNAWAPAWDSPIHDIGDLVPNIMTYSHTHADHYDPDRIPDGVQFILFKQDSLEIDGLEIKPIRVCESNINIEDNTAYLFSYRGMKFLHLGDAQAQIMNIENDEVQNHIKEIIPDSLDMLFMTIEGTQGFIEEVETYIDLLKPKRIIPMHYWSTDYKMEFLSFLSYQASIGNANYEIVETPGSKYDILEEEYATPVKVISLIRSEFSQTGSIEQWDSWPLKLNLNNNYPNPFTNFTTINYELKQPEKVLLTISDFLGNQVYQTKENQPRGNQQLIWNTEQYSDGVYYFTLQAGEAVANGKMVKVR